jgi:pilus assembly protein Flp/PilA
VEPLGLARKLSINFWRDEAGATAIEYCLIAAGIGLAVAGAVSLLGTRLNTIFSSVATAVR